MSDVWDNVDLLFNNERKDVSFILKKGWEPVKGVLWKSPYKSGPMRESVVTARMAAYYERKIKDLR